MVEKWNCIYCILRAGSLSYLVAPSDSPRAIIWFVTRAVYGGVAFDSSGFQPLTISGDLCPGALPQSGIAAGLWPFV